MAFSNSFHSSAKKHAIGSASKLGSVEAHNERNFTSARYNADKSQLIHGELGLANNVQMAINDIFREYVEEYNRKQRRKDRRITESPFEHFCNNSKLDIAAEAIYQIGDREFWSRWRTDEVIGQTKKGKDIVRHTYPPEVVTVMSEIYRRQMDAYESIYQTHGQEILAKIQLHYDRCQDVLNRYRASMDYDRYAEIAETKPKDRRSKVKQLNDAEQLEFAEFSDAYHSVKDIEKRQYRERIIKGQMHIRNIQGVAHFDEWSAHAHGVSICWTDGYRNGLSSRVAKAVVLNRFALEVIQDRLHEIAQEEIAKHPEIFRTEELKEKGAGRNLDYSAEQIARQKQQALLAETESLKLQRSRLSGDVGLLEIRKADIDGTIKAAEAIASELQEQNTALASEMEEICRIKTIADYDSQLEENQDVLNMLSNTLGQVRRAARAEGVSPDVINRILRAALDAMTNFIRQLEANIAGMKIFEWLNAKFFGDGDGQRKPVAQEQQRRLDSILENAGHRSEEIRKNNQGNLENGVTIEPVYDITK